MTGYRLVSGLLIGLLPVLLSGAWAHAQTGTDFFLHGTGPENNPPTLFLNLTAPTATTAKFRDSAAVNFSGGNPWKDIGTWPAAATLTTGTLTALSDLHVWLGLKNSDDQGTHFDLHTEVLKNGAVIASGLTRCITGIVRNANQAKAVTVAFGAVPATPFNGTTDQLAIKLSTRIGTNPNDTKCPGHNSAVGLRLYFDATTRQARFDATLGVITNPIPIVTALAPAGAPAGSPTTQVTVTGEQFVPTSVVKFNATALTTTFVSATSLTATIPASLLTTRGSAQITVENPPPGGGISNSLPFTIVNGAPVLAPIGNKTVPLGSTLTFTTTATDPDNDPLMFAVTPLPLPAHAAFHTQTGVFTFTPDASQVGQSTLTFLASDGVISSSETVMITVTGPPAGGVTSLTGRVDDTAQHPLANLTVSLKGTALTTTTAADGTFTLTAATMPTGRQQLVVTGLPQGFANLVAPVDLIPNVTNQLPQALTLPPIDAATAVTVNPAATTILTSATLNVTVTIPPNTAKHPDGTPYTGQLTLSPVPEYGRPESRPVELRPGLSVTIQPAGIIMDPPAPITFPNQDNLAPGNELDLWSLSPDTGTFLQVGTLRVSADGTKLDTISGGIRTTAWHFPEAPSANHDERENPNSDDCTQCPTNSSVDLSAGALRQDVVIPGVRTLGVSRDLTLQYQSTSADVRPILPLAATLSSRAAVPQTFSARVTLGGVQQGGEPYWNSSGLPETVASVSGIAVQIDASHLPTGRYPYELMLFSHYPQSSIGGGATRQVSIRNERGSAFGSGWTLRGVDRLLPLADGSALLAQGAGPTARFTAAAHPLVVTSVTAARSSVINSANMSFVDGQGYAQPRADLLNPQNFGPGGVVSRPVTLKPALTTVTLDALAGVDVFILNELVQELSFSEAAVLEQFVREGGTVLEVRNFPVSRPLLFNTLPGQTLFDVLMDLTVAGMNEPPALGPFGTVPSPVRIRVSTTLATTGFTTVLGRSDIGPVFTRLQPGNGYAGTGRVLFVGDHEIFASGFLQNPDHNLYALSENRRLFLNSLAYLAGAPGFRPSPPPSGQTATLVGPPGDHSTVVKNGDGSFTRRLKAGTTYQFTAQGLQTAMTDRNGNMTSYAYDGSGRLTTITDPAGQVTTFAYSSSRLASITDPAGRVTPGPA